MLNVSSEYLAAIRALSQTDKLTGTIKFSDGAEQPLTEANFGEGSVSIERQCCSGEDLEFGAAILGQFKFSLRTEESRYVFYDAKITPTYSLKLANGSWYDIPLGVFTVAEADRKGSVVAMTAYDNLVALNKDYGGAVLYGKAFDIMTAICETCGVQLAQTEDELDEYPNGTELIQIDETTGCQTYRDCARVLAQMMGSFVVADNTGAIALRRFAKEPCTTLAKSNRQNTTISDYVCHYSGLVINAAGKKLTSYDVDIETGLELSIEDAPAWDYGMEETLQARCDTLLAELSQIYYTPTKMTIFGDPSIECGDMLTLETDDGEVNTLVTGYTWRFRGKMEVESAGSNPYLKSKKTQKTKVIRDLEKQTEENRLIFYSFTNQSPVVAESADPQLVSQVTFVTTKQTSAMFMAQLPLVVDCEDSVNIETTTNTTEQAVTVKDSTGAAASIMDASGKPLTLSVTVTDTDTVKTVTHGYVDVQIEYYIEGTLVDYELIQRLHAGGHILSLFYAFDSLDGDANFLWQVKIKVVDGNGTVTVPKRGLRATITGQGMAGTEVWDGTLTFDEAIPPLSMESRMTLVPVTEEYNINTQIPKASNFEERVSAFTMQSRMTVVGFSAELDVNPTWERETISAAELTDWTYNDRFVESVDGKVKLRTAWQYESKEQRIDSGRMTVVKAVTNDLASVEEVSVSG